MVTQAQALGAYLDRLSITHAIMDAMADGKDGEGVIAEVTRDPTYFFRDRFIVLKVTKQLRSFSSLSYLQLFEVENTLFRILLPHLLKRSGYFRDLCLNKSLPPSTFTEANPFVVNDITVQEFRHFLRIT